MDVLFVGLGWLGFFIFPYLCCVFATGWECCSEILHLDHCHWIDIVSSERRKEFAKNVEALKGELADISLKIQFTGHCIDRGKATILVSIPLCMATALDCGNENCPRMDAKVELDESNPLGFNNGRLEVKEGRIATASARISPQG